MIVKPSADTLASTVSRAARKGPPPVHLWNPPYCGEMDLRITRDGSWIHEGTPIGREAMVRLFASILKKEEGRFYLVTPVEKLGITVEDAPFIAVDMEVEDGSSGNEAGTAAPSAAEPGAVASAGGAKAADPSPPARGAGVSADGPPPAGAGTPPAPAGGPAPAPGTPGEGLAQAIATAGPGPVHDAPPSGQDPDHDGAPPAGQGAGPRLTFVTNVGDRVTASADNPIRVERDPVTEEPAPYVHIRRGLEARIDRKTFYRLVDLAQERDGWLGVTSCGSFFPIAPVPEG